MLAGTEGECNRRVRLVLRFLWRNKPQTCARVWKSRENIGREVHMHTPAEHLQRLTRAWVLLCFALAIHVADEAATGFLAVYNPTVTALRAKLGWWPMPTFSFGLWLAGLIVVVLVLLGMSLWVVRGSRGSRIAAYLFGTVMLLNGIAHIAVTIRGATVEAVRVGRPAPGFYSALLLIPASLYLLMAARRAGRAHRAGLHLRAAGSRR